MGEVALLRFDNQHKEAKGITDLCTHLVTRSELSPSDILILLRSDRNGVFSNLIREKLEEAQIPVTSTGAKNPLDTSRGRTFLAFLQLTQRQGDSLAWRSLLQTYCTGIGEGAIGAVNEVARDRGQTFAQTVMAVHENADILPSRHRSRLTKAITIILMRVAALFPDEVRKSQDTCNELMKVIRPAATSIITDCGEREAILLKIERTVNAFGAKSLEDLIQAVGVASEDIEQELEEGKINILTMHRAKGLTAEAVIVAAAEDQYIPGRAKGGEMDDERRLLYVSLTRAKHHLFITYCDRRTGQQRHTGRDSGRVARSLSQFLVDCPHVPRDGTTFISELGSKTPNDPQSVQAAG